MQTIAYLRVSTVEQDLDTQRLAILDYVQQQKWHKERGILDLLDWPTIS